MLLSFQHLADWLGYKRPSDVRGWLEDHGIRYMTDRRDRPIIREEWLDSPPESRNIPRWDAARKSTQKGAKPVLRPQEQVDQAVSGR